jgi:hypothetical protein
VHSDGSCIEGSHKGWNSLQHAQPSGIIVFITLGHDHVHRRNICIATSGNKKSPFKSFDTSTFGSHHTRLVNHTAKLWNKLRLSGTNGSSTALLALPKQRVVDSNETFGLVDSEHTATFGSLFPNNEVKAKLKLEDSLIPLGDEDLDRLGIEDERLQVVDELGIDAQLLNLPLEPITSQPSSGDLPSQLSHSISAPTPAEKTSDRECMVIVSNESEI